MGEQQWGDRVYRRARRGRRWAAVGVAVGTAAIGLAVAPSAASAATFTVTSTADSGPGSLRQAILDANANAGADVITFGLTAGSVIAPTSPLPAVTGPVTINGYSAVGAAQNTNAAAFDGTVGVTLDGTGVPGAVGLDLSTSSGSVVRGLRLQRWTGEGGALKAGPGTTIEGNIVQANGIGISVGRDHVTVGGNAAAERNVIIGNQTGVSIVGADHTTVAANLVGLAADGVTATGNDTGILVGAGSEEITIGGTGASRNVVSGNSRGIYVVGLGIHDIEIYGNYVGTTAGGNAAAGNTTTGIELGGFPGSSITTVKIGDGTVARRNVVAGNTGEGIGFWGGATGTTIKGNSIGVGADGTTALGNNSSPVFGENYGGIVIRNFVTNTTIGGTLPGEANVIANNVGSGVSMFTGSQNRILGNSIYGNTVKGINLFGGGNNNIASPTVTSGLLTGGNALIGYSYTAAVTYPVRIEAFEADNGQGRTFLTAVSLAAAGESTISLNAATAGLVDGDSVVLTATDALGNTSEFSAPRTVNAPPPGGPNLIVNSTGDGGDSNPGNGTCSTSTPGQCTLRAAIEEGNALSGARITFNIPSGGEVVTLTPATNYPPITAPLVINGTTQNGASCASWPPALKVQVTGGTTGALFDSSSATGQFVLRGLVINGYAQYAVKSMSASITCNLFGTTPDGITTGPAATGGAILAISGTIIGGEGPSARNLFGGSEPYHIEITQSANGVYGNFIGTTLDGQRPQGTGVLASVRLWNLANGNNIGTSDPTAPGNRISGAARGVTIESNGGGNQIRQNSIFGTTVQGIDLGGDGVTFNHEVVPANPTPGGPNNYQNYPLLTIATSDTSLSFANTRLAGELAGVAGHTYEIDLFRSPSCAASNFGEGANHIQTLSAIADGNGVVRFDTSLAEFATPETWGATATATDMATRDTSEFSYCRPVSTPNLTWGAAQDVANGSSTTQYLTDVLQEKWFKVPVLPGSNVKVTLTAQPGSAVSLHTDPTPIFNQLQNPASAAALSAEAADTGFLPSGFLPSGFLPSGFLPSGFLPSGFLPSGFLPSGFLPSGFLPSGFLPSGFLPSGFLPSGFLPSGFLPSGFLPSGFLPSASLPSGFLPSGFLPSGFLPSGFLPSGFLPAGAEGAYDMAARRSLLGVSNDPTATVQTIERNAYDYDGDLYVRVVGPYSLTNTFTLTVAISGGKCGAVLPVPATLQPVNGTVAAATADTLIVTDSSRLPGTATEIAGALASLRALAARTDVNGVVIDLADAARYPRVAFANAQADANLECAAAKNRVADEIKNVLDVHRNPATGGSTHVAYVVLAGGASVIPFHQVSDVAGLAPEKEYIAPVAPNTASEAGLRSNLVKGQDFYGTSIRLNIGGRLLDVPDQAVGRLVETATDISAAVTTYINTNGVVTPRTSVTTGYDFVGDGAQAIADQFTAGLATPSDGELIQPPGEPPTGPKAWTADQLRRKLFGPSYDIVTLTGHFSAGDLVAADYTTTMAASEVLQTASDLTNTIVLALGCHSGFSIPNGDLLDGASPNPDWAKAFLRKGAVTFVAATGYAYGDTEFTEYGERLFVELAKQMRTGDGPVPMGAALVAAKRAYMAATPQLTGIDEKTIVEMTLYGLPMVKVDVPGARLPRTGAPALTTTAPVAVNGLGLTSTTSSVATPVTGPLTKDLTNAVTNAPVTTTYYRGVDGVVANPYEPVQPKQINDVTRTGQVLRGVAFRGGTYTDLDNVVPLTSAPATETSVAHTSYNSPTFYPAQVLNPNLFDAVDGGATRLVTVPGQFRSSAPGAIDGTLRTYGNVDVQLYYLPDTWTTAGSSALKSAAVSPAPEVVGATATINGTTVTFEVTARNAGNASVQSVWIVYTGERGSPLYGRWQPLDLVPSTDDPTTWTGTLGLGTTSPGDLRFMVGAVNSAGLTSLNTGQGAYFTIAPATPPPPPVATTIALSNAPTSVTYTTPATLSAQLTTGNGGLGGQVVVFDIGGQQVLATTDTTGVATATLKPFVVPGGYTLQASFRGTSGFTASSVAAGITVTKMATSLTLTSVDRSTVRVRLLDAAGVPLAGQSIVFVVSSTGTTPAIVAARAVRTDGAGVALFGDLVAATGSYTVDAYFDGRIPLTGGQFLDVDDSFYLPSRSGASVAIAPPDRDKPTITVAATSNGQPYTANTWTKSDVLVDFTCDDGVNGSGIASCGPDTTVTAEGTTPLVTGTAVDNAGNTATTTFGPVLIDRTAPTATISTPASGATYALNAVVNASFVCADARSGVASCLGTAANGTRIDTATAGPKTFTVTATDAAGNVATTTVNYTVAAANQAPVVKADMGIAGLETIGFQTLAVALTGSFADADGPGPFTASVRWQAGGAFTPLVLNNNSQFIAAFIYPSAGTRVATVRICDAKGACGTDDVTVVAATTLKITPVRQCVLDRGAARNPRYAARFGYNNPAPYAIAVPVVPTLENFVSPNPALRGQPLVFLPGTQRNVFDADFNTGTVSWKLNGVTVSATTTTTPRC